MFVLTVAVFQVALCSVFSINLSQTRSYFPSRRYLLQENSTTIEEIYDEYRSDPSVEIYDSGFLRLDTYDWLRIEWIQGQVLPIGVCFKEGYASGSAMLAEVVIVSNTVFRKTNVYFSDNCTGQYKTYPFVQPRMQNNKQLDQIINHVADLKDALVIPPNGSEGIIVSSYYSSEGCVGNVAQYDLVSEKCSVYGYPIGAMGNFYCDEQAQSLVLTLYGPFDEDSYTYPMCIAQEVDDVSFAYNSFYAYYEDGAHVYKQPLSCYEESSVDQEEIDTPYFQTIQCVHGTATTTATTSTTFTTSTTSPSLTTLSAASTSGAAASPTDTAVSTGTANSDVTVPTTSTAATTTATSVSSAGADNTRNAAPSADDGNFFISSDDFAYEIYETPNYDNLTV